MRRIRPRTLRGRIALTAFAATMLLVVALVWLSQFLLQRANDADARSLARSRADGVAATLRVQHGRVVAVEGTADRLDPVTWVYDGTGRLLDGDAVAAQSRVPGQLTGVHRTTYLRYADVQWFAAPVTIGKEHVVAVAMVELDGYEHARRHALWLAIALGGAMVAAATGVAIVVNRRSLAVVREMSRQADLWQEHDLGRRFGLGQPHDEIGELGRTLDHMLDRIASVIAAERRLTDEIAHELRTPLTVIRGEAQLAQRAGTAIDAEGAAAILSAVDRLDVSIRTMLRAARARDLGEGDTSLGDAVNPLLERRRVRADVIGAGTRVRLDRELLSALLAPLVDNAERHAHSWIRVRAVETGEHLDILVEDDGPGFVNPERAFEPKPGELRGIGLVVVRRLARVSGAEVSALPGPGGCVVLRLPTA